MRLRDKSGDLLCIIESTALVSEGGKATGDTGNVLVRVNQHMMNTCTSLFFDASTGQMSRLSNRGVSDTAATSPPLAVLLSRVDDSVDCGVIEHLREVQVERAMTNRSRQTQQPLQMPQGASNQVVLPVFRIDAICDASARGQCTA